MAIWLEIHCDGVDGEALQPGCKTTLGDNPAVLTNNDRQAMMDGLYSLEFVAKKKGWKKSVRVKTWTCPICTTVLANKRLQER